MESFDGGLDFLSDEFSDAGVDWPGAGEGSSSSLTLVYFVVAISLDVCIVVVRLYRGGMRMEPGGDANEVMRLCTWRGNYGRLTVRLPRINP